MEGPGQACRPGKVSGKTLTGGRGAKGTRESGSDWGWLPRKASKCKAIGARTANRHRWAGREYQGERENLRQGTRQNNLVTSGEGVPYRVKDRHSELWEVAVKRL